MAASGSDGCSTTEGNPMDVVSRTSSPVSRLQQRTMSFSSSFQVTTTFSSAENAA